MGLRFDFGSMRMRVGKRKRKGDVYFLDRIEKISRARERKTRKRRA